MRVNERGSKERREVKITVWGEHERGSPSISLVTDKPVQKQRELRGRGRKRSGIEGWGESVSVLLVASMPPGLYTMSNDNTFLRSLSGHYCRPLKIPS